jgi:ABC-2 type transport system permease protein
MLLIAKREYLEQVRGRAFRLTTVLLPVAFVVMAGAGFLMDRDAAAASTHVVIASNDAPLAGDVRRALLQEMGAKFSVDVIAPVGEQERDALLKLAENKSADGLLWIESPPNGPPAATYTSRSTGSFSVTLRLQEALNRALLNQRLTAQGMSPAHADAFLEEATIKTLQVNKNGALLKTGGIGPDLAGTLMALLLTMSILLYGLDAARSIIEEKSSRIFEVMLSAVKADDLFAGKLLGVGAVGLTQVVIWVAAGALLMGSALAAPLLTGQFAIHLSWSEGILFPLYFLLGFFLYSAFFSGLAATCETAQELQMYMPFAAAPVWLSFGMIPLIIRDPNSTWSIAASCFPLTSPFVMMFRVGLLTPPAWQFLVSISLLALNIWAVLWFSTRLYRVGILMYGKRATLPELLRWLRYS